MVNGSEKEDDGGDRKGGGSGRWGRLERRAKPVSANRKGTSANDGADGGDGVVTPYTGRIG